METLISIKKAIREKKVIAFTYDKADKEPGTRFGNPHAVYKVNSKSGKRIVKVHIVQTGGASDSNTLDAKSNFIVFDLNYINNVQVKNGQASFEVDPRYNPDWPTYHNSIQKI
jgi:hypothetical protein